MYKRQQDNFFHCRYCDFKDDNTETMHNHLNRQHKNSGATPHDRYVIYLG